MVDKLRLVNMLQGGTIKLLVKYLNIELESDQGSAIGVEVQDKVNGQWTTSHCNTDLSCTGDGRYHLRHGGRLWQPGSEGQARHQAQRPRQEGAPHILASGLSLIHISEPTRPY